MNLIFWLFVLGLAVWGAHWGADKIAEPLQKLRSQWGLTEAAGAAFVALATASPDLGVNATSAMTGVSDIGLGNMLGAGVISVPVLVTVAYIAAQKRPCQIENTDPVSSAGEPVKNTATAKCDRRTRFMRVKPEALTVQALPYLAIIGLAAVLILPKPWRGLQPIDGWIMVTAYFAYLTQAIVYKRQESKKVQWRKSEIVRAVMGIVVLAAGAYFIVMATENIVSILGISQLVGGLFITSTISMAPAGFATWSLARSGQVTTATTSVIADNTVTMTLAFLPLALVNLPVNNVELFSVNLMFVALLAAVYAWFIKGIVGEQSFRLSDVLTLNGIYAIYLCVMLSGVIPVA